jgi:WD40 repeat protein
MAPLPTDSSSKDQRVNQAIAAYLAAAQFGQAPDRQQFLAAHSDITEELAAFLADREQFQRLAQPLGPAAALRPKTQTEAPTILPGAVTGDGPPHPIRSFGDYELLEEIARGGMGVVYKARQIGLGRTVALKMILAGQLASPGDVQRFRAEAEAAANLDHPNIVPIYEVGEHDGQHFFSMNLIKGHNLAQAMDRGRSAVGTKETQRFAAQLVATVARAVHHAHQRGILHRDLKPANILLRRKSEIPNPKSLKDGSGTDADFEFRISDFDPLVTDFGLAKRVQADARQTQSGAIVGTPTYMAPEQAAAPRSVSTAADVYGLGAILYEMLTGRPPFQAATAFDTLRQVLEEEPPRPQSIRPGVDKDLETICLKCLAKEPGRRYASAEALAEDLERWLHGEPIRARRTRAWERVVKWVRRRPAAASLLAVSVLAALGLLALAGFLNYQTWKVAEAAQERDDLFRQVEAKRGEFNTLRQDVRKERDRFNHARYATDVQRAGTLWETGDIPGMLGALKNQLPANRPDLRNFEWFYLWRLAHAAPFTFAAHQGGALCVAFSPDGRLLATGGKDHTVKIWNLATGRQIRVFTNHTSPVRAVAFSPDGQRIISASGAIIFVWDARTGKTGPSYLFNTPDPVVAFTPDGTAYAAWKEAAVIKVVEIASERERAFTAHAKGVHCLAFSPDGRWLASSGQGNHGEEVTIWKEGDKHLALEAAGPQSALRFSSDGRRLAGVGRDNVLNVWETATGRRLHNFGWQPQGAACIAFGPHGRRLALAASATVDKSGAVAVCTTASGNPILTLRGHTGTVEGLAFSLDGKQLASASADGTVKVWDVLMRPEARLLADPQNPIVHLAFSADGKWLRATQAQGMDIIWDTKRERELCKLAPSQWTYARLRVDSISPDFQRRVQVSHLLAGKPLGNDIDGTLWLSKDLDTFTSEVKVGDTSTGRAIFSLRRPTAWVYLAEFSPDGKRLALASVRVDRVLKAIAAVLGARPAKDPGDRLGLRKLLRALQETDTEVTIWDANTGRKLQRVDGRGGWIYRMAFSPDGQRLAVLSFPQKELLQGLRGLVEVLAKKPPQILPQKTLAGKEFDHQLRLLVQVLEQTQTAVSTWDLHTGRQAIRLRGGTGWCYSLTFSPDGRRLALASLLPDHLRAEFDRRTAAAARAQGLGAFFAPDAWRKRFQGQVKVWDSQTGRAIGTMRGAPLFTYQLAFSPDTQQLAGAGGNRAWPHGDRPEFVEGWDALTGRKLFALGNLSSMALSPDGRRIASSSDDRTVKIWEAASGQNILLTLHGHKATVTSLAFSLDGRRLASVDAQGILRIWEAGPPRARR